MEEIESESKFIWRLLLHVLLAPITLILVLFKRKGSKDLLQPFTDLYRFLFAPKFTISIIILNIIIYFLSLSFSETLFGSLINYPADLIALRWHSLFTAGFLHADLSHLFGNLLGIFIFGRIVERKIGSLRTGLVYFGALFISGLFSSAIHLFVLGNNIGGLGASGALMGLVATAILLDPVYITYELLLPLPVMVVGWVTIYLDLSGILNPVEDGIGHFAHLGGFISIAVIMYLLGVEERTKLRTGFIINVISLVIGLLLYWFLF
ncbi:MAG: rhomboid family intramembrane serine protease [Candidatus Woesearchaeota archaeon]